MYASLAPLKRRFQGLNDALHEKLTFSTTKNGHSLSTVFWRSRYDLGDQQKVVVEFEPNGEESCTQTSDRLRRLCDDFMKVWLCTWLGVEWLAGMLGCVI